MRDALGSVRAEVSDQGAIAKAFRYAAYGEIVQPNANTPTLLGFAGELRDPSGLIYLRARWYDAAIGRFVSKDRFGGTIGRPETLNGFNYAAGRPALLTDASGTDPAQRGNWAYAIADVFGDLDSSDPVRRNGAYAIVVASGFAGWGIAVAAAPAIIGGAGAVEAMGGVYLLRDPVTNAVMRTGRTIDLARREAEHARDVLTAALRFETAYRTDDRLVQRGLEQILYDQFPEAALNKIRPIALGNPSLSTFIEAAQRFLAGGR